MSLNSKDRQRVSAIAESKGYGPNSDGSRLTNGRGGSVTFSETGKSVRINGGQYNTPAGARKSTKW
ncbi:MAG: hypothetical protein IPK70_09990 [Flavobacteriales bacterium]|jgi:DNA-binding LacI/PurR family transcriptional regulator|nr:hypothetical protein [Flavobacteriales bacterium]